MLAYQNLNQQFIAGQWQKGQSEKTITNFNPFDQSEILVYKQQV